MKKFKNENQYAGGKRNIEEDRKLRLNNKRDDIKGGSLFRNGTEPNDYEDRDVKEKDDYRLRANRSRSRNSESQRDQSTARPSTYQTKMDSVKAEMHIRGRGSDTKGKPGHRNENRKNEESAENN